jgi:hypothetical protein
LLGFSRRWDEAETITWQLSEFLPEKLSLTLSPNNTMIMSAPTEAARFLRVMLLSVVKTLANQHHTSVNRAYREYCTTVPAPHGTLKGLEVQHERGKGKRLLGARFGGFEPQWQKKDVLSNSQGRLRHAP